MTYLCGSICRYALGISIIATPLPSYDSVTDIIIIASPVLRFASAATETRGPRPWRGFTHGPQTNAKFPLRVRMRPDHKHGNGMGRVDMERGPDSV